MLKINCCDHLLYPFSILSFTVPFFNFISYLPSTKVACPQHTNMRAGTIKSSEMEWLHSQSQKMQIQLEPRRTRSGINYDVYMSDEDTEDDSSTNDEDTEDDSDTSNENTYTSDGDHDTSDEDTNTSVGNINMSDEDTDPSDYDSDSRDKDTNTNDEDTDMNDEIIEIGSLSDEVGSIIDLTAEDTDEDDFQGSDEPEPSGHSTDVDTTPGSWLEEWPEQCPARADLMVSYNAGQQRWARANKQQDMQRYQEKDQDFHMPARRHNQTFREKKYGKPSVHEILVVWIFVEAFDRHFWLPSAFDHPRGRPYEIVCQRVWDAWHRTQRRYDSFTDVVASIEKGGEHDWPNVTPEMLQFPQHRVRHRQRNTTDS
jgi:hypothetical protein